MASGGKATWGVGLGLFITGSIGNMVAMAFASASILVPLESSQFVTNIFFSLFVLKKHITLRQWAGTSLAVVGTVLTCVFGPNDDRCFTIGEMAAFWVNPLWLAYLTLSFAAAAAGWAAYFRLRGRATRSAFTESVTLPALFAVSSALLGGAQIIVHSKALAELFDLLFGGAISFVGLLSSWFFWVELLITAGCGIFWALQMNKSLGLYDPLFIIPLLQSSYITLGATASGLFYREFENLHLTGLAGPLTWLWFLMGMAMIVVGILLLAPSKHGDPSCLRRRVRPISKIYHVEGVERIARAPSIDGDLHRQGDIELGGAPAPGKHVSSAVWRWQRLRLAVAKRPLSPRMSHKDALSRRESDVGLVGGAGFGGGGHRRTPSAGGHRRTPSGSGPEARQLLSSGSSAFGARAVGGECDLAPGAGAASASDVMVVLEDDAPTDAPRSSVSGRSASCALALGEMSASPSLVAGPL